jgi:hypothetical protein
MRQADFVVWLQQQARREYWADTRYGVAGYIGAVWLSPLALYLRSQDSQHTLGVSATHVLQYDFANGTWQPMEPLPLWACTFMANLGERPRLVTVQECLIALEYIQGSSSPVSSPSSRRFDASR